MPKLHHDAVAAFNAKADKILASVHSMPMPHRSRAGSNDVPVARALTDDDIKGLRVFDRDRRGLHTGVRFDVPGRGLVGIDGEHHEAAVELTTRIARTAPYRASVSDQFAYNCLVSWLEKRLGSEAFDFPFVEFFEREIEGAVRRIEVWIPLPGVTIPHPIPIGLVTFRRITKEMMDAYAIRLKVDESPEAEVAFQMRRNNLQGVTAACLTVEAEHLKAEMIAKVETESAVAMMRFACPYIMNPWVWCPIDPTFVAGFGGTTLLHVEERQIVYEHSALPAEMSIWHLHEPDAKDIFDQIWKYGHNLIVIERNEFQSILLNSLIHYSKSLLKPDISERLMYIITALEMLFVGRNEQMAKSLSERLAIILATSPDERLHVATAIGNAYDDRSRFVHDAVPVSDRPRLEDFFLKAWTTMYMMLGNYRMWKTKADMLAYIDSYRFRGPQFSTQNLSPVSPE
jgi:hypothetical protein